MQNRLSGVTRLARVFSLTALVLVTWSGCKNSDTGEEVFNRLERGETIDFNSLSCKQLVYLDQRYQAIIKENLARKTPATEDEKRQSYRAYATLGKVASAKLNNGC